jgi:hypothetical protein
MYIVAPEPILTAFFSHLTEKVLETYGIMGCYLSFILSSVSSAEM